MTRELSDGRLEAFLEALSELGNVSRACERSGVSRSAVYDRRRKSEDFANAWDRAEEEGTEVLEQEAFRRALEGVPKPVYYKGIEVGAVQQYSDRLLIELLRARKPEKYRERFRVDANLTGNIGVRDLTREQLLKIAGKALPEDG